MREADVEPEVPELLPAEEPQGVEQEFEAFFRQQFARVARGVYLTMGSSVDPEEIAQEAMVRVLSRWARVRKMERPEAYAFKVAANMARRRARRHWPFEVGAGLPARDETIAVESRTELVEALRELPQGQRDAIVLSLWFGLTAEEVGKALGIRAVSVRARIHRARRALAQRLRAGDQDTLEVTNE